MIWHLHPFKKFIAVVLVAFFITNIAISITCSISHFVIGNLIARSGSGNEHAEGNHHHEHYDGHKHHEHSASHNEHSHHSEKAEQLTYIYKAYLTGDDDCCSEGMAGFYGFAKSLHPERTIKFVSIVNDLPFIKFATPNYTLLEIYKKYHIDESPPFVRTKLHIDHQLFLI